MKKAALICVTRNNAAKLLTTLNSIIRHTKTEHYDLFLIDNASSDETLGIYQLKVLADNITIVRSGKNLHWVGGINLGLGMTKDYQYVGFLNDDIELCPNWLENFFDVLDSNPDVAAVGPLTSNSRDWQGYDQVRSAYNLHDLLGVNRESPVAMYEHIKNNGCGIKCSDSISLSGSLLRRECVDSIGLLDASFAELYCGESKDYCWRLLELGKLMALSMRTYFRVTPLDLDLPMSEARHNKASAILQEKFHKTITYLDDSKIQSAPCRHGTFTFDCRDSYVGKSLHAYGEWAEAEVALFSQLVKSGDSVVEAGANIGSHTIPLARLVYPGIVHAFEPQPYVHSILKRNKENNKLDNIVLWNSAIGSQAGVVSMPAISASGEGEINFGGISIHTSGDRRIEVPLYRIDDLEEIVKLEFLKIDVEGFEKQVLLGASEKIKRFRPIVFIESQNREDHTPFINNFFENFNYTTWHYNTLIFNLDNYNNNKSNIFGRTASYDLLCLPTEKVWVEGLVSGSEPPPLLPDDYWKHVKVHFKIHN